MAPKKKRAKIEWRKLGEVGIDSATLLITDPAYIYSPGVYPNTYQDWLEKVLFPLIDSDANQINFPLGHPGAGVAVHLVGDGMMEGFAKLKDGVVVEIKIK